METTELQVLLAQEKELEDRLQYSLGEEDNAMIQVALNDIKDKIDILTHLQ